ncbi:hypothetical protein YC2023_018833 [Brassica napus]
MMVGDVLWEYFLSILNLIAYNIGCSSSVRRLKSGRSQELITTDLKRKANMESGMWPIQLIIRERLKKNIKRNIPRFKLKTKRIFKTNEVYDNRT